MRRINNVALVSLGLLLGTAGCTSFLTGEKLTSDPNLPSVVSAQQLFVAVQAGQFAFEEGTVAMMMCEWVQACAAANGRFVQQAGQYVFGETSNIGANGGDWLSVYDAGGLADIRQIKAATQAAGDSTWLGITKIWEAFTVGTASDMWGDIPYSQVTTTATPALDNRFAILASIQTLLSEAVTELGSGHGPGPGSSDLVLGGDPVAWAKVAHTLKARYFMHTAESLGTPAYTSAITEALLGISDNTGASDFSSFHTAATSERNMWAQFQTSSGFGTDLEAGKFLVDYMNSRTDPRLASYFCKNASNTYGGDDFNSPQPPSSVSNFACLPPRFSATARIPYVSYAENELILAEAYAATGDAANALVHLNNELATVPLPAVPSGLTAAQLRDTVMMEKYVAMFQNIESINDYRRTCIPAVTVVTNQQGFTHVPGRLFYPQNERNVNPNIPDASTTLGPVDLANHWDGNFFRNPGDQHACQGSDNAP